MNHFEKMFSDYEEVAERMSKINFFGGEIMAKEEML